MFLAKEYLYNLVTGKIKGPLGVFFRGCLFALSLVYKTVVVILAGFYRIKPVHLNAKVISVGNITLGGTGKTTLVEYLSAKLSLAGNKVAVLSRGYKRDFRRLGAVGLGDEPTMLKNHLPLVQVVVDKDRIKAAQIAIRNHASDTLILDDGLQQWKIFKDLEIVTLDAENPFGNYRMLPAGFLREPLFALKRADIFVLTQTVSGRSLDILIAELKRINAKALIVESQHEIKGISRLNQSGQLLDPSFLKGESVAIFSGIGNPEGFRNSVCSLGAKVVKYFKFADHYDYTQADILRMIREARQDSLTTIITTPKDAVKVKALGIAWPEILVLEIKLNIIKNEAEFNRRLFKLYSF